MKMEEIGLLILLITFILVSFMIFTHKNGSSKSHKEMQPGNPVSLAEAEGKMKSPPPGTVDQEITDMFKKIKPNAGEGSWQVNRFGPVYKGGYVWCTNCDPDIAMPRCKGNRLDLDCDGYY